MSSHRTITLFMFDIVFRTCKTLASGVLVSRFYELDSEAPHPHPHSLRHKCTFVSWDNCDAVPAAVTGPSVGRMTCERCHHCSNRDLHTPDNIMHDRRV